MALLTWLRGVSCRKRSIMLHKPRIRDRQNNEEPQETFVIDIDEQAAALQFLIARHSLSIAFTTVVAVARSP